MSAAAIRRFLAARRGTAAIEFVFVLPVMLLIFAGIIEFGRAWQVYDAVNRLATRYAIGWADCSDRPAGVCGTELSLYTPAAAVANFAPQLTNPVSLRMFYVRMGAPPTVFYAYPAGATPTAAEYAAASPVIPVAGTGVIVTVTYTHSLVFFQTLMSPFLGNSRAISYTVAQINS